MFLGKLKVHFKVSKNFYWWRERGAGTFRFLFSRLGVVGGQWWSEVKFSMKDPGLSACRQPVTETEMVSYCNDWVSLVVVYFTQNSSSKNVISAIIYDLFWKVNTDLNLELSVTKELYSFRTGLSNKLYCIEIVVKFMLVMINSTFLLDMD